jgi:hypothetical protein
MELILIQYSQFLPQGHLGLKGGLCLHITPDIHDPVDMGINADCRFVKSHRHNKVCGFPSHTGQFGE